MASELPTREGLAPPAPAAAGRGGHFPSGTMVAGRYRIVAPLGRGGMGEVYRAEDLKLGQAVALKFLPPDFAADPGRVARFFAEARLAREVTHPSVCRVHDVGQADGQHFLSMEYVDGEDLASLLRRIGRLPAEKGLEIARQVCAGLAAAHGRGVLHRDLKPANVMIDGRGRARLTDFGLAVLDAEAPPDEIAGTPGYMAPEQVSGGKVTARTDVYGLGLVLYELFTGRPAFTGGRAGDPARGDPLPEPSRLVPGLDPAIETAILRCLETDPARRPPSALAVAAALPGGDPLTAMVAAGETPPPEMVAAAGGRGAVSPAFAWGALALALLGAPLAVRLAEPLLLLSQVPLEKPPDVLADRARELARRLGAPPGPHHAHGLRYSDQVSGAETGAAPGRSPIVYWHRQSSRRFESLNPYGTVTPRDPPMETGMATVFLDVRGRLVSFQAAAPAARGPIDWEAVLAEAGLEAARLRPVAPSRLPPVPVDARRAWEGAAGEAGTAVRVEAGTLGHALAWIDVGPPQGEAASVLPRPRPREDFAVAFVAALVGAAFLARRNVALGRGDRRGAWRLAAATFLLRLAAWALQAPHTAVLSSELDLLVQAVGRALYLGGLVWLLYMAIEPTVRRHWPGSLVSWTRVVAGRWRDPLVGRDVLVGCACAGVLVLLFLLARRAPEWMGASPRPILTADLDFLLAPRRFLGWVLLNFAFAVSGTLFAAVTFVGLRLLLRRTAWAVAVATGVLALLTAQGGVLNLGQDAAVALAVGGVIMFVFLRYGFLAVAVATFLLGSGQMRVPVTLDLGAWYGQVTLVWLALGYTIALYGLVTALGRWQGARPPEG